MTFKIRWLYPDYWHVWLIIFLWGAFSIVPRFVRLGMGRLIGRLGYVLLRRRRTIVEANLALCEPHCKGLSQLAPAFFEHMGMSIVESSAIWWGAQSGVQRVPCEIQGAQGLDSLRQAFSEGTGVLLMAVHNVYLEVTSSVMESIEQIPQMVAAPRPHNNPLIEYCIHKGRHRWLPHVAINPSDYWSIMRVLRQGHMLLYFPDQDYGAKSSVFAPFFGIQAATRVLGRAIARRSGAKVILTAISMTDDRRYRLLLEDITADYRDAASDEDATHFLNSKLEEVITQTPEQWLWAHRRFKTRPPGEPPLYPRNIAKTSTF
ncbi:MAG: hypothetical protein ACR2PW_01520 [Gammaproteobacteria bacterium]